MRTGMGIALALLAGVGGAAPSFHIDSRLQEIGFKLRGLSNARPVTRRSPRLIPITMIGDGGASVRRDVSPARELWFNSQTLGSWKDKAGNSFYLAQMSSLPVDATGGHPVTLRKDAAPTLCLTRDEFHDAFARGRMAFSSMLENDEDATLVSWMCSFVGSSVDGPLREVRPPVTMDRLVQQPMRDFNASIWAFKPRGTDAWYACLLRVVDGTSPEKAVQIVETQFLPSVAMLPGARAAAEKRIATAATEAEREKDLAESTDDARTLALASIKDAEGWWTAEMPGYLILTDARTAGAKRLVKEMQRVLPAYRRGLKAALGKSSAVDIDQQLFVIRFFEDETAFHHYYGDEKALIPGTWWGSRRELILRFIANGGKDADHAFHALLYREAFSQYLSYAYPGLPQAFWFSFGHQLYYANADINGYGKLEVDVHSDLEIRKLWRSSASSLASAFQSIFSMTGTSYSQGEHGARLWRRALLWGFIYFLREGGTAARPFAKILPTYLAELEKTRDADAATQTALAAVSVRDLAKALAKFCGHVRL